MVRLDRVALVTGGGRGIGANIARELADAGMRVAVSSRTRGEVESVARDIDGVAVVADVSKRADVERMVGDVESQLGPIELRSPRGSSTASKAGTSMQS